jgi:DNA (cytosine-5)-methyltransferase 1
VSSSSRARRWRLIDLCCKAGGASAGYHAAGFDVVGVDIEPQPDYPFPFIQADALSVDLSGYDVVAASPPCQHYSVATPADRRDTHPDLIAPMRARLAAAVAAPGGPWAYVMENVPGAPLRDPIVVCGDTLRLGVRRHRLFESNLPLVGTGCHHDRTAPAVPVYGTYGQRSRRNAFDVEGDTSPSASPSTQDARDAMGIDWMPWPALTQAIPPAYTFWLGVQLAAHAAGEPARRRVASPRHDSDATPPAAGRCRHCAGPLPDRPVTGRWPRYCSHACRQAAYRARRGAA